VRCPRGRPAGCGTAKPGRSARGQGLVEFSLIVPVFLLLLLGVLEFGFMFNHHLTLQYATREGARAGAAMADGSVKDSNCGSTTLTAANVDPLIVAAVERVLMSPGSMVDVSRVSQVRIFKSTASGTEAGPVNVWLYRPGDSGNPTVPCQGTSQRLNFYPSSTGWPASSRVIGSTPDSLGVAISYDYLFRTPLSGILTLIGGSGWTTVPISDRSIMALQPTS